MTVRELYRWRPGTSLALAIVVSAVVVAGYVVTSAAYINHDCFVIAEAAQAVVNGKALYISCWDNKPPLGILFYAIPQILMPGSYSAMQGFLGMWFLIQAATFIFFMRDESWISALVGAMTLVALPLIDREFTWASTEHWQNLFVLLTVLPILRLVRNGEGGVQACLLSGASLLFAIHCRQSAVPLVIVPILTIVTRRASALEKLQLLATGIIGAILGESAILVLTASVGSIGDYLDAMFFAPARYTQQGTGSLFAAGYFFIATTRSSALLLISVTGLVSTWARREWLLLATFGVASVLMVLSPCKPYPHYVSQLIPFVAVAMQCTISQIESSSLQASRRLASAVAVFLSINAVFSVVALPSGRAAHLMKELTATATAIQIESTASDTLFAVGEDSAYLYFATNCDRVHPIFWDMFFGRLASTIPYPIEQVMDCYKEKPPSLLVLRNDVFDMASHPATINNDAGPTYLSVVLSQRLLCDYDYKIVAQTSSWKIMRRQGEVPAKQIGPTISKLEVQ